MREHDADLVAALRALGDDLVPPGAGEPDVVVAALARITAAGPAQPANPVLDAAPPPGVDAADRASDTADVASVAAVRRASGRRRRSGPASRWSSPRRLAAVAAVVAACVVVAVPGPRTALARLLGIGGVRIAVTGEVPDEVSRTYDLGEPVPMERALAQLPASDVPGGMGAPVAAFAGPPEGVVTLVWPSGDRLPDIDPARSTGLGLILSSFPGTLQDPVMRKEVGPAVVIEAVTVAGHPGYWIAGAPHEVGMAAPSGEMLPDTVRLAGNTLLWTVGSTTYRLESALDRAGAMEVAEHITPRV